jgi:hypothetical protein
LEVSEAVIALFLQLREHQELEFYKSHQLDPGEEAR